MATHIALLRAVNVGGSRKVAMAELRGLVEGLGFGEVRSLLQSGNLVFTGGAGAAAGIEALLERAAKERLGLETDFLVRSAAEWRRLVAANPFPDDAGKDPGHLVAVVLKTAPAPGAMKALQAAIKGRERVAVAGRTAYIVYPDGIGRAKLTHAIIERALGTRGTGRNWNTVLKLAELAFRALADAPLTVQAVRG